MALLGKLKGVFDRGGIGLKLELPRTFSWGDPTIPATITLTGHKDEPRQIEGLSFAFVDEVEEKEGSKQTDTNRRDGDLIELGHEHPVTIDLGPKETVTLKLDVPCYTETGGALDAVGGALDDAGAPKKLVEGGMKFLQRVTSGPEDVKYFRMTVSAHVVDVKRPKRANRRIRNQRAHGFKSGGSIAGFDIS